MNNQYYDIEGKRYYRVTHILANSKSDRDARMLQSWKERVGHDEAKKVSTAATVRGTALHKWAEDYLQGIPPDFEEETALPFWPGFKPVLDEISQVDYQETRVYHPRYEYAGTLDLYGTFQGVPNTLVDFKTSSKRKQFNWIEDYCLQVVAYAAGVKYRFGISTNQAAIVIALPNKDAQVFILNRDEMEYYWGLWLQRLEIFKERQRAIT